MLQVNKKYLIRANIELLLKHYNVSKALLNTFNYPTATLYRKE